mmetsp:Transcript_1565/g.2188  ORF Transcript_1565/g.2188 Transcript_1565/m.2188 type:complete len:243 (+) Transcript_1565:1093-1821(+)
MSAACCVRSSWTRCRCSCRTARTRSCASTRSGTALCGCCSSAARNRQRAIWSSGRAWWRRPARTWSSSGACASSSDCERRRPSSCSAARPPCTASWRSCERCTHSSQRQSRRSSSGHRPCSSCRPWRSRRPPQNSGGSRGSRWRSSEHSEQKRSQNNGEHSSSRRRPSSSSSSRPSRRAGNACRIEMRACCRRKRLDVWQKNKNYWMKRCTASKCSQCSQRRCPTGRPSSRPSPSWTTSPPV